MRPCYRCLPVSALSSVARIEPWPHGGLSSPNLRGTQHIDLTERYTNIGLVIYTKAKTTYIHHHRDVNMRPREEVLVCTCSALRPNPIYPNHTENFVIFYPISRQYPFNHWPPYLPDIREGSMIAHDDHTRGYTELGS